MKKTFRIQKICAAAVIAVIAIMTFSGCSINISTEHYKNIDSELVNPNADENAKGLMNFLVENYGKKIISGQYINEFEDYSKDKYKENSDVGSKMTVFKADEVMAVYSVTGKYPAMLGFDLSQKTVKGGINYSIEQAIEFHNAGGIVNFCWHWNSPVKEGEKSSFYTKDTKFSLKKTLNNPDGFEYKKMIDDIDTIANELKVLQAAGVPIIWRPLHEASGGWFWWGASGADAYKRLWDILYDRLTNTHGLNNLIWVSNSQNSNWYVGDEKCDIIGDDPYYANSSRSAYSKNKANSARFNKNYKTSKNKLIAMTENDFIPDIDAMWEKNTKWSMFCTWCREFVCAMETVDGSMWQSTTPVYGEKCNTREELLAIYSDLRTITL